MQEFISRRALLVRAGAFALASALEEKGMADSADATTGRAASEPFGYCLNTSTLRGHKLPLADLVEIAAKAGYHAIEPWIEEIEKHAQSGGSLSDLKKRIHDHGLTVESAIGFAEWIVDDDGRRAKGLEHMRRDMDLLARIGGKRIAAPPIGATDQADLDLLKAADRYRAILELGDKAGVVPQMEIWGFSKTVCRLGQGALVAIESGHSKACVLADVYHLYKGGSDHASIRLLSANSMHVLHINDYPANPPRETISDADRVYPGDGIAPLDTFLHELKGIGYRGFLSLELFNESYWKQDPLLVARTGLEKIRAVVHKQGA